MRFRFVILGLIKRNNNITLDKTLVDDIGDSLFKIMRHNNNNKIIICLLFHLKN